MRRVTPQEEIDEAVREFGEGSPPVAHLRELQQRESEARALAPRPMPDPIAPALTPEEWESTGFQQGDNADVELDVRNGMLFVEARRVAADGTDEYCPAVFRARRHALAALALHGQPFGFTREDIELLRAAVILERWEAVPDADEMEKLRALAARIAALLPPEG